MNQGYLQFNPEQFDQTYRIIGQIESTDDYDKYLCKRRTNEYSYIAKKIKQHNIDNLQFAKLRKMKLYNILPVLDLYREENLLVSQDFEQYSLFNQSLDDNEKIYVASLVSITLQELCLRGFPFRINPKKIFLIDNHVCLQQIDFEFNHIVTNEECFQSFLDILKYLEINIQCNNFEESTNELLEKQGITIGLNENMPFADFLDKIFSFQNCGSLVRDIANSYIYQFDTPDFMKTIPGLSNKAVLKSTKIDNSETDQEYLIRCADRELKMMENFKKYEPFASCFAYFRIQKQLFIFMEKYPGDLEQAFTNSFIYDRNIKDLCCQLAVAIRHLHRYRIIHRDLKPANLFLSHEDLDRAKLLIADFDHSIDTNDTNETEEELQDNQINFTGLTPTSGFQPPETGKTQYDYKADIWQVGMIFYQIANQGIYPVQNSTLYWTENQFRDVSNYENIRQNLQDKFENEDFIKLIADCLSFDPRDRPNSQQLIDKLIECFGDLGIDDEETLQSTHYMGMVESMGQLLQRSRPLRLLRSSII